MNIIRLCVTSDSVMLFKPIETAQYLYVWVWWGWSDYHPQCQPILLSIYETDFI